MTDPPTAYWSLPAERVLEDLGASAEGLTATEVTRRRVQYGPNRLRERAELTPLKVLLRQFQNPLLLILVGAAAVSLVVRDWTDAGIVVVIVVVTAAIGFARELGAERAASALRERVRVKAHALRDGEDRPVPLEDLVPGDVVLLEAGALVPADALLLESNALLVNEAVLTGESYPAEKRPGPVAKDAPLSQRTNVVHLGTNVRSGTARAVVVRTGRTTVLGEIAEHLLQREPETEFDRGLRRLGYLLTRFMVGIVVAIFALNVVFERPVVESLLFSVALAVGITPELLPAILAIDLSQGARRMAARGVLVRRLPSVEDLGSMDVLCTDKTGTLTVGSMRLMGAFDAEGNPSEEVAADAWLNASFQTGLRNPMDDAILAAHGGPRPKAAREGEVPYDFQRRRLSVIVREGDRRRLLTKGAVEDVLDVCTRLAGAAAPPEGKDAPLDDASRARLEERFAAWSAEGHRVLALASREVPAGAVAEPALEEDLAFEGFLVFEDPLKPDAARAVADLAALGVRLAIVTGDHHLVAEHAARAVGIERPSVLTGAEVARLGVTGLLRRADRTDVFAQVDPSQKERIVLALGRGRHVVGYLGDGINDAPALHAADVGISVDTAVDVAKEAADFVLLEPDLSVLMEGIKAGRATFANTLKYVMTTTSANLGNMVSMAIGSLVLPFFPLTAGQILLNNLLSDVPAMALAGDRVDPELVERPRRWDERTIRRFMIGFGLLSSVFDFVTFGLLLFVLHAEPEEFRTGWFVESLLTELVIALVVRTKRPFWKSAPSRAFGGLTALVALVAVAAPYLPGAHRLGFVPLPPLFLAAVVVITALYVLAAEGLKRRLAGW